MLCNKLFFCLLICLALGSGSCGPYKSPADPELEKLKAILFNPAKDLSELPVHADPPTGDYEDMAAGKLSFNIDSLTQQKLLKYKNELEPFILQRIDSGYCWVYLSAYMKYKSAVPLLKRNLLACDNFYGWEGGDYTLPERYLDDEQYCYQMPYIVAIEYITGQPLNKVIILSEEEQRMLDEKARNCAVPDTSGDADVSAIGKACSAKWLLGKLK